MTKLVWVTFEEKNVEVFNKSLACIFSAIITDLIHIRALMIKQGRYRLLINSFLQLGTE